MADKKKAGSSLAISAVFYVAVLSALIVAGSFEIIKVWPASERSAHVHLEGWSCLGRYRRSHLRTGPGFCTDDKHFVEED
ncbi:MAG: hypothetical protein IPL73_13845 [Candidatus Obscuribacter sp.]|nr:hypothetical protein [Candidatus Obscuribacter sp.]